MVKKVKWTALAQKNYKSILLYLEINWSLKVAEELSELTARKTRLLARFPALGCPVFIIFINTKFNADAT